MKPLNHLLCGTVCLLQGTELPFSFVSDLETSLETLKGRRGVLPGIGKQCLTPDDFK